MIKSIGLQIVEQICRGDLTVPILARAMGMWLGEFERLMVENQFSPEDLKLLAKVSQGAWTIGGCEVDVATLESWQLAYADAADGNRVTITQDLAIWEEPGVKVDPEFTTILKPEVWVRVNPAFTLVAYERNADAYNTKPVSARTALRLRRFAPSQETINGVQCQIWRWNPEGVKRPVGGRPQYFQHKSLDGISVRPSLVDDKNTKVAHFLKHYESIGHVTLEQVAFDYYGYKVKGKKSLATISAAMKAAGWNYNQVSRRWVP